MTRRPAAPALASTLCLAACVLAGCPRGEDLLTLRQELSVQRERTRDLTRRADALADRLADANARIETLLGLGGPDRLGKLFRVNHIHLARYTGGVDTDGKPGHDAVKVFLEPRDADGHTLKAAGDVEIRLYDLAADANGRVIGQCRFPVETMGDHFAGGFGVYHFRFYCPWTRRPEEGKVTVWVRFVDYLTGQTHTAQLACTVNPAPREAGLPSGPRSDDRQDAGPTPAGVDAGADRTSEPAAPPRSERSPSGGR